MHVTNYEIKAKCRDPERISKVLREHNAEFRGTDRQRDTYFRVARGRLKLREGNIENNLIHYRRADMEGPKASEVEFFPVEKRSGLKDILLRSLDILCVVEKERKIFFIDNVKFHIDTVEGLGSFVEIEAIDRDGTGREHIRGQCEHYMRLLDIREEDLCKDSYSDMIMRNAGS